MDQNHIDQAERRGERRALARLQQHLDRQQAVTVSAVILGVSAGVAVAAGVALFVLSRGRQPMVMTDDPEAPLFV